MASTASPDVGNTSLTTDLGQDEFGNMSSFPCLNNSELPFCRDYTAFTETVKIVVPVFFGLISIVGVVGNMLVIIVVVSNKRMRNTTNLLIINLAFADLLFSVICVPFTATIYAIDWPFGLGWCKIYQYIVNVTAYASVYTLVGMSLDRYLAVVHPISSMTIRTERNAYIVIGSLWVVILSSNVITAIDHGLIEYPDVYGERRSACLYMHFQTSKAMFYYASFFAFGYVIPLFLVCVLYGFMLKRLLYRVVPGGSQSAESLRSKKRVTYMIIIVVVTFAVCWLPIQVVFLMTNVFDNYPGGVPYIAFKLFTTCLAYMNSCVNPFLYAFLSENFRKSFRKLLCCYSGFQPVHMDIERTNARALEHTSTKTTALNGKNGVL